MKKITNNAKLGKISMILNGLILVCIIVTMVLLINFDKKHVTLLEDTPYYEAAQERERKAQEPLPQIIAEVEYYAHKLDTLKLQTPEGKEAIQFQAEEMEKTLGTLTRKQRELDSLNAIVATQTMLLEPLQKQNEMYVGEKEAAHSNFKIVLWITILAIVAKILVFAKWNATNLENLRVSSKWMEKGTKPFMSYIAWIIPFYNFYKPYVIFNEIWNETEYILKDKNILQANEKDENTDFNLGLWWAMFIITAVLYTIVLNSTFFSVGSAMFVKFSHTQIAVWGVILWAVYLIFDAIIIRRFNKLAQLMYANQVRFEK